MQSFDHYNIVKFYAHGVGEIDRGPDDEEEKN
jgi:hypothetical protein